MSGKRKAPNTKLGLFYALSNTKLGLFRSLPDTKLGLNRPSPVTKLGLPLNVVRLFYGR